LRLRQFDTVTERSEFLNHSCRSVLPGLHAYRRAPLFVTDSLVQNLPDQAATLMGNHSDGLIVPHPSRSSTFFVSRR